MSNETEDNKHYLNSSSNSQDLLNKNSRNTDIEVPKSRLSSASKKNEERRSSSIHEHIKETRIKSPPISSSDRDQLDNNKLINKNQSPLNSLDNEEQPTITNPSHTSLHLNELSNDGPTTNQYFHDEQTPRNINENSADINADDENQEDYHGDLTKTTHLNNNHHSNIEHPSCQFRPHKKWLELQFHENGTIKKPDELENEIEDPPGEIDPKVLDRIQGSIIGMALGDALGAHVEFRPYQYMQENPVKDLEGGGTWGLVKGQFTDDTSMALCLANSLVARRGFVLYDQLVRYKWWHKHGYMSSTGQCFDIGAATRQSLNEFERRQKIFAKKKKIPLDLLDKLSDPKLLDEFSVYCSEDDVAGNGALMRLAPVPLFFFRYMTVAVHLSGHSAEITHGDQKAYDACRLYGALIVAALRGLTKKQILAKNFYSAHKSWFGEEPLHEDIKLIAEGSYKKKGGHKDGIAGKGYIVKALEAALWAFWSDEDSFEKGALAAVNLGDDTDTTAAIYGQLAGAYYGYKKLPRRWLEHVYARKYMVQLSKWIAYEGEKWKYDRENSFIKT